METLTVHLGLDELVDHWTLLADKSDLRWQARCAVGRDRAGGLLALVGAAPHLPHRLTSRPIRRSPSPMALAPVLWILAALRAEEMT
jgi:hypothetical protein